MAEISYLQNMIAADLAALNRIIAASLESDNALMQEIVVKFLEKKGKQIRPILVILSGKYFGKITDSVLDAGAAIELIHNASLIHDDVIDQASKRRGVATINHVWDNHIAVLVGDFFTSTALSCAVRTGDQRVVKAMAQLGATLALGEIGQINNARHHTITEKSYFDTITKKTASLFRTCVEVGGYAAGGDSAILEKLMEFAVLFGQCFQIKDDTFDYFDSTEIGKPTGNDLREGKITLPLIYALSRTELPECGAMQALAAKESLSEHEIATLIQYAKTSGGIEYSFAKMEEIRNKAVALLDGLPEPNNESSPFAKASFLALFDYILDRKK